MKTSVCISLAVVLLCALAVCASAVGFTSVYNIKYAAPGSITVDGDLSDWSTGTEWIPFDTVYDGNDTAIAADINEGSWAAKWSDNGKYVYIAAKVYDKNHVFTNSDTGWDQSDRIEIYFDHPDSRIPGCDVTYQEFFQQWKIGVKPGESSCWASIYDAASYTPTADQFVGRTKVVGDWIYYEAKVEALYYFGGLKALPDVVRPLVPGKMLGLDVCVVSCGPGTGTALYNGMLCSEYWTGNKSWDWNELGQHLIEPTPLQTVSSVAGAKSLGDSITVSITEGKAITAALGTSFYIEDDDRASGIRVISNYAAVVGNRVTVTGVTGTLNGEKVIYASDVQAASGTNMIEPLGSPNKSLVAGLPMTGLLTRTWGKVTEIGPTYYTPTGITGTYPGRSFYTGGSTDLATLIDGNIGSGQHDTTYCAWGGWTTPDLTVNLGSYRMIDKVTIHGLADGFFGTPYFFQVDVGGTRIMNEGVPGISGQFAITRTFSPISANSVRVYIESWSTGELALSELQISGHDWSSASYVKIDDGSGLNPKVDLSRVTNKPRPASHVAVTGVCSAEQVNNTVSPVIIPRSNADLSWPGKDYAPASITGTAPTRTAYSMNLATLIDGNIGSGQHDTTYCAWGGWTAPGFNIYFDSVKTINKVTIHGLADGVFGHLNYIQLHAGGLHQIEEYIVLPDGPFAITRTFSPVSVDSLWLYFESWYDASLALSEFEFSGPN